MTSKTLPKRPAAAFDAEVYIAQLEARLAILEERRRASAAQAYEQRRQRAQDEVDALKHEALRLRRETGKRARTIAKVIGVHPSTCQSWIKRAGL